MTLARNLGAVVLAAAWLLSVSQGTFSQANAQAQSPSPGPSDRTTAIPDQKLDAAAAVLERIASLKKDYEQPLCGCRRRGPRSAAGDDGIHEDKELAGAGDEGELMSFSSCDQALVDRLQLCIPIEDSRQGCCVEALPQALASAFDVPWTAS